MGALILYIVLAVGDVALGVFDIFKGYYRFSVVWFLLAAYFVYRASGAYKRLRSGGGDNGQDR